MAPWMNKILWYLRALNMPLYKERNQDRTYAFDQGHCHPALDAGSISLLYNDIYFFYGTGSRVKHGMTKSL